jgi:2-haloacid dehalogenase
MSATAPRALLFDVFGTCVDWRSGVAREGAALAARLELPAVDWAAFADAWRALYGPQLETVRSGRRPWTTLDELHREALDRVLAEHGLEGVPDAERDELTRAWHRLDPWPDVVPGLLELRRQFLVAPCSNGHIALQVGLARHGGLPWHAILGAELARAYKPDAAVYLRSVEALGLRPAQVVMVACHGHDLRAAAACGLRTAFVRRPLEHGPGRPPDGAVADGFDAVVDDFGALARALT